MNYIHGTWNLDWQLHGYKAIKGRKAVGSSGFTQLSSLQTTRYSSFPCQIPLCMAETRCLISILLSEWMNEPLWFTVPNACWICPHNLLLTSEWLWLSTSGKAQLCTSHSAQQQNLILDFTSSISWPELWNMPGFMHPTLLCASVCLPRYPLKVLIQPLTVNGVNSFQLPRSCFLINSPTCQHQVNTALIWRGGSQRTLLQKHTEKEPFLPYIN